MEKLSTLHTRKIVNNMLVIAMLLFSFSTLNAQVACTNGKLIYSESFGTGTTITSSPNITSLIYQDTGDFGDEGVYRIANNTQQRSEWHASGDHTGDLNGKMLVANGEAVSFFQHVITDTHGFSEGIYVASVYIMNLNVLPTCEPDPLLPVISLNVEYLDESNNWVPLAGSPITTAPLPQTATPVWINVSANLVLPATGSFFPQQMRITMSDQTGGGCGNDFAMDDVSLTLCPEGGVAPVTFINVTAQNKGNGVNIDWSTSQEINNSYFEVQRSADGSSNWNKVATVNGAGNSQVVKNYSVYDATPYQGVNFYRIRQVDVDGKFEYSKTVSTKLSVANAVTASVLINPFYSALSLNFSSATRQMVSVRLIDITGRQVASEKWTIEAGNSRKDLTNISGLQQGMYILSVTNNAGDVLLNKKVIKQ
ncbi:MAG: T9SS type A sorting domain-containing protein [Ginsengibacter sp.]